MNLRDHTAEIKLTTTDMGLRADPIELRRHVVRNRVVSSILWMIMGMNELDVSNISYSKVGSLQEEERSKQITQ